MRKLCIPLPNRETLCEERYPDLPRLLDLGVFSIFLSFAMRKVNPLTLRTALQSSLEFQSPFSLMTLYLTIAILPRYKRLLLPSRLHMEGVEYIKSAAGRKSGEVCI